MFDGDDGAMSSLLHSHSCSHSGMPASSAPSKGSHKVTERHFTPWTHQLAIASKAHVRTHIQWTFQSCEWSSGKNGLCLDHSQGDHHQQ